MSSARGVTNHIVVAQVQAFWPIEDDLECWKWRWINRDDGEGEMDRPRCVEREMEIDRPTLACLVVLMMAINEDRAFGQKPMRSVKVFKKIFKVSTTHVSTFVLTFHNRAFSIGQ